MNTRRDWKFAIIIALSGCLGTWGVVASALAAHGRDPTAVVKLDAAARMLTVHAIALLALVGAQPRLHRQLVHIVALLWGIGTIIFAGTLTLNALAAEVFMPGWPAPWGGGVIILGWVALTVAAFAKTKYHGVDTAGHKT